MTRTGRKEAAPMTEAIRAALEDKGFDAVGFTRPTAIAHAADGLRRFLREGRHGTMDWMEKRSDRRAAPHALWPQARTVIVAAMNYGPLTSPRASLALKDRGTISCYAQGKDYHDVMKKRLKAVARWMADHYGCTVKVFVDTAPVMEKPLAMAAGLGWQGKHTNLVSRDFGSWLFLGSIFTDLDLTVDAPYTDHCGTCRACLDACPTDALPAPYEIDARRCISYLTIEHKGSIPRPLRQPIGNRIYGCDECLAVCPWNKYARAAREMAFHPHPARTAPSLADLARLDDAAFRALFAGSAVKRIGRNRFVRNVAIAIGNSEDPALRPDVERLLGDSSALVRAMAVWALARLASRARLEALARRHLPLEGDAEVRQEWRDALATEREKASRS